MVSLIGLSVSTNRVLANLSSSDSTATAAALARLLASLRDDVLRVYRSSLVKSSGLWQGRMI
jgi:hypothetical protein